MTDNMKNFLEVLSKDEELKKKAVTISEKDNIIAFAKEAGVELTEEDLQPIDGAELSEEELEAASGGMFCIVIGGGEGRHHTCFCMGAGMGDSYNACVMIGYDH